VRGVGLSACDRTGCSNGEREFGLAILGEQGVATLGIDAVRGSRQTDVEAHSLELRVHGAFRSTSWPWARDARLQRRRLAAYRRPRVSVLKQRAVSAN